MQELICSKGPEILDLYKFEKDIRLSYLFTREQYYLYYKMKILKYYVDLCAAEQEVDKILTLAKRMNKFIYIKCEDSNEKVQIASSLIFDYTILTLLDIMREEI